MTNDVGLPLTGERTVPGVAAENYWFRRHEAVYAALAPRCRGTVLEAGCGEGYGADVVVSLQVVEHLWEQERFVRECARVLRPGGTLLVSTPNRLTFSPGRDTPLNPFHSREFTPGELAALLLGHGFDDVELLGLHHGPRLRELDARHGGSIAGAQVDAALSGTPWPRALHEDVAGVAAGDFVLTTADLDASLDVVAIAR